MKNIKIKPDKNRILNVKVTASEKEKIAEYAAESGSTISEYVRTRLLAPNTDTSAGALRQDLARQLCRHAVLVQSISDEDLRTKLIEWSERTWQLIK